MKATIIYADTAGVGRLQPSVIEKINLYNKIHGSEGKAGVKVMAQEAISSLKIGISKLINCTQEDIGITGNTTEGINIIANGYNWQKGDRVLIPDNEYPANVYPWLSLKKIGVEVDFIPTNRGVIDLGLIQSHLHSKTKILALSHIGYLSGYRAPIDEIGKFCKENGVDFFVDAAQSAGLIELDVQKSHISALATCGWKWLMGPVGTGFIYCSKEFIQRITPTFVGMDALEEDNLFAPKFPIRFFSDARKFEYSSLNIGAIVGLNEAINIINSAPNIEEKTLRHVSYLHTFLKEAGFKTYLKNKIQKESPSGILSVKHPKLSTKELHDHFINNNIHTALWHGYIRFSPSYLTTKEELKNLKTIINNKLLTT
ncbi:aminotransferase class V-fold PLP-dependent enzyme [Xanthovirga aplysinae]|uniref:aminotransferase class V-fold PLP-dependent enzyme n=1 Tax=Xanthovirga aplysinae TaxID=2529853 RepID=UPI0012BBF96D|nr:aminotransferase class V-fold PLP-dependent enzyme [Xanthovirga aplysinae]MTI30035.1 aminotransferase class V-fold PLP-dependent enzyme [Xanthovirga aplysinae]